VDRQESRVNAQVQATIRFHFQREALDRWAVWRENGFYDIRGLQIGRTPLEKVGELGVRVGVVNYSCEPDADSLSPKVEAFMRGLMKEHPKAHLCLEARHRRIVGAIRLGLTKGKHGRWRPYFDRELSEVALGDASQAGRSRFNRLCDEGYARLKSFLA
jgi:hypothetical protein